MENKILEIKFFLIPFALFIFLLIVFENIYVFLFALIFFLILYTLFAFKYKNISFITLLFFIASLSLFSYTFFMKNIYQSYNGYEKTFLIGKKFLIDDILTNKRYLLKDEFGNKFILKNANKNYQIGEIIKIYGMMYPINLDYKNFQDFKKYKFLSKNIDFQTVKNIFKFNYTKYLMMKNIVGTIYSKREIVVGKEKLAIYRQLRQYVVNSLKTAYKNYDDRYIALSLGLLIGDKSFLSKELYDQFIHSGLVHIIVVSGGNIMFLIIFLSIILFFIPFYLRLIIIGFAILFYAFMVGGDSSVIRATIMGLLSLIALFYGKVTDVRRLLAISFIIMLIYNPYFLIYDLGFILSFLAILGILVFNYFSIPKNKENKFKNGFIYFYNNYILPTLGASLFTAPAILLFTNQVNLLSFLASIFVVPIVPILMLTNFFLIFFHIDYLIYLNIYIMDYIFFFSHLFGDKFTLFLKI